jgi:hypothetical protein
MGLDPNVTANTAIRYFAGVLSIVLLLASFDKVPDPPAVDPHSVKAKALGLVQVGGCLPAVTGANPVAILTRPPLVSEFVRKANGIFPPCRIALTRVASDSSPPAL